MIRYVCPDCGDVYHEYMSLLAHCTTWCTRCECATCGEHGHD